MTTKRKEGRPKGVVTLNRKEPGRLTDTPYGKVYLLYPRNCGKYGSCFECKRDDCRWE